MKLTDGLLGEHALFYALIDRVEQLIGEANDVPELRAAASLLEKTVVTHARLEEELLLCALEQQGHTGGPLAIMRAEHEEIEDLVGALSKSTTLGEIKEVLSRLVELLRSHFRNEETFLFPASEGLLGESALSELGARWAVKRGLP